MFSKILWKTSLFLLLASLLAGCTGEIDDPMPEDLFEDEEPKKTEDGAAAKKQEDEESASKPKRRRAKVVKRTALLKEKDIFMRYIREGYYELILCQQAVVEILGFTGPTRDFEDIRRAPRDIMKIHKECLHMVQRGGKRFGTRFFKDVEIFLIFKAAYDDMTHEKRLALVNRWKKKYGLEPPPMPEEEERKTKPYAWLRSTELFWKKGGRFWWWAQRALMSEEGLKFQSDGRVVLDLPEFDRPYSS